MNSTVSDIDEAAPDAGAAPRQVDRGNRCDATPESPSSDERCGAEAATTQGEEPRVPVTQPRPRGPRDLQGSLGLGRHG